MSSTRQIYLTQFDVKRLKDLIREAMQSDYRGSDYIQKLKEEIDRGIVVTSEKIPADTITMNTRAQLVDIDSGEVMELTLVFPKDADVLEDRISVLAPIGCAMLGYRVGDVIEWDVPDGVRKLKVKAILYQPEASGDMHL